MPVYEITVEGKKFHVEISRKSEKSFEVKFGDKKALEAEIEDELEVEKTFRLGLNEKTYTVELDEVTRRKPFQVKVNDYKFTVEFKRPTFKAKPAAAAETAVYMAKRPSAAVSALPEGAVVAPMTGKIVSVKVKKGDTVKRGDVMCVLEAMKMENEILAPKDGVVQEVSVSEGSSVSEGDVLLVIK